MLVAGKSVMHDTEDQNLVMKHLLPKFLSLKLGFAYTHGNPCKIILLNDWVEGYLEDRNTFAYVSFSINKWYIPIRPQSSLSVVTKLGINNYPPH
jgi:hypothetical protein